MASRIAFGGIPIQRLSESDAIGVVKRCIDLGINFLDTANGYTNSEERIGKAIAGRRRELILATKTGARDRDGAWAHLRLSLERLKVDYIDVYQLHGVSSFADLDKVKGPGGALEALHEAKAQGLIKHIGITSHNLAVAIAGATSGLFETVQFPFNFVATEAADELLPKVREHDLGFIGMKPLAGGNLDRADLCVKYLLQFPEVLPDPGIERIEEIEQIVAVASGDTTLTVADQAEMERIRETLKGSFCHRCEYCQPCPQGIAISSVMNVHSMIRRMPGNRVFEGGMAAGMQKAFECLECGDCESRCPYKLPIRETLKVNREVYRKAKDEYLRAKAASE
jgi:uncharacterized protein